MIGNIPEIPEIHPIPGTTVQPRRRIVIPNNPTCDDWWNGLRILADAAEAGEPCPVIILAWDDGSGPLSATPPADWKP